MEIPGGQDNLANLRVASFSYYLKPGEESFVQKINGGLVVDDPLPAILTQEPSFPIASSGMRAKSPLTIIKPSQNFNFSQSIDVPSFSPHHLNTDAKENIVFRVKAPIQDVNAGVVSPQKCSTQVQRISCASNGEIGVFGADKYFNMKLDYGSTMKMINGHENERPPVDVPGSKLYSKPGTPSVSSEASSWNSQAALLRNNLSQKGSQARPTRANRRRIFASLGCGGPCLDKEAISVAENRREHDGRSRRLDHFAFPILNNGSHNSQVATIKKPLPSLMRDDHEETRKSLDVFGSGRMKNGDVAVNLARKLSMLTWDAIPKSGNGSTTTVGSTTICDDMTSDASSDLFEIEDISGTTRYSTLSCSMEEEASHHNNHGGGGGDVVAAATGFMSPPAQYAPSEASIEWSVVTASAADFSSVISDYDEKNISISAAGDILHTNSSHRNPKTKNLDGKEGQKGRPGGLLGCKSHKAVNVAETVVHKTTRTMERKKDSSPQGVGACM